MKIKEIEDFERSNDVVDAICVYNILNNKFIYNENLLKNLSSITSMIKQGCFNVPGFLYLKSIEKHFFISYNKNYVVFSILKDKSNFNKVILEHKTNEFLQLLSIPDS